MHIVSTRRINAVAREEYSEKERIIGGQDAEEGQFPYAVALYKNNEFICTSSILSKNTIVTAAHCIQRKGQTDSPEIIYGIAHLNRTSPELRIEFASVIPHPNYTERGIVNDIAILKTTQPIPYSDTVQPICIARSDTDPMEYNNATATGWGDTSRTRVFSNIPDILQYVEQRIMNNDRCSRYYFRGRKDDSKMCDGDLFTGICNGDSGGPLVHLSADKKPVQIGVASYGSAITGCGFLTPSVWTRVSFFEEFIKENSEDDICEI